MRRYTFYLAVALSAFGIGSFMAFTFYWKTEEKPQTFQNNERNKLLIISNKSQNIESQNKKPFDVAPKGQLTCKDKTLRLVWNELKEVAESIFADESEASGDCTDFFNVEKFYDLDGDGKDEIFIRSQGTPFCGAVGNCQLYVFRRKANSYKAILYADMAQRFNIKSNKSNGYFDVETSSHGSSTTGVIGIYRFNGKEYEVKKCFNYDYADKYDRERVLDEPTLTKISCWKDEERSY